MAKFEMNSMLGLTPEEMEITRKQKYAERLRAQSETPMEGRMVGRTYVPPSWTQGIANMLSAYGAGKIERQAGDEYKANRQKMAELLKGTMAQGNVTTEGPAGASTYMVDGVEKPFTSREEADRFIQANDPRQELGSALYGEFTGNRALPANTDFSQYAGAPFTAPDMRPKMGITEVPGQTTKTTSFDIGRVMQAAMQDPENPLFGTAMQYMANQQAGTNKTAEQKNWEYAMGLPEAQRSQFLGGMKPGSVPSAIQEWSAFQNMSPEQQEQYLRMKRADQILNLGGTQAVRSPMGGIREEYRVTPRPEDQPGFKAAQTTAVKGAERAVEKQAALPQVEAALSAAEAKNKNLDSMIDDATKKAGFWTTGFMGTMGEKIPGTPAHDLGRKLDSIKANLGFAELQAMRDSSPSGGALGSITERELALLQSAWDSVAQSQSEDEFKKALLNVKRINKDALERSRAAYRNSYGSAKPAIDDLWGK